MAELDGLVASGRAWRIRRHGAGWEGVLYGPDGKTPSRVTWALSLSEVTTDLVTFLLWLQRMENDRQPAGRKA